MQKPCNCILEGKSPHGHRFILNNGSQYRIMKTIGFGKKGIGMLIAITSVKTNMRKVVDISGNCDDFVVKFQ